jgi:3-deoxy-D-manno-octulosonate 8-phosphate phosphatase (KDO 8-P phosphatase)
MTGNFKEYLTQIKAFVFDIDGVLASPIIYLHPSGEFMQSINTKDGYILHYALQKGYPIAIISGGNINSMRKRFENLGFEYIYMDSHNKMNDLNDFLAKTSIKLHEILYMGDDIPDLEVMKVVGMPTCPADAVPEIKNISKYISIYKGGAGCVRDVVEQVLRVHGKWI